MTSPRGDVVVREVVVELDPPDNIAVATIEVDSATTRVAGPLFTSPPFSQLNSSTL